MVKLAPVVRALEARAGIRTLSVSTSQHAELAKDFAQQFGLRIDRDLEVMLPAQTLSEISARVISRFDPLLVSERPDLVLVQGDTTTAMSAALAAFHRGVPVGHVEAGLRSGDPQQPFPEEMNRRLITRIAQLHFAATPRNVETLRAEGVPEERIFLTGNPVVDALHWIIANRRPGDRIESLLAQLEGRHLIVLTTHRRENHGRLMGSYLRVLRQFLESHPNHALVFPVHPNPAVRRVAHRELAGVERCHMIEPLAYPDFVHLLAKAWLIVSDSGGVQEEAPSLAKPLLVLRGNTERPEAIECGVARLVGRSAERLRTMLGEAVAAGPGGYHGENPFGDGRSGERIAELVTRYADAKRRIA